MMKTIYKAIKKRTSLKLCNIPAYRFIRKRFIVSKTATVNGYKLFLGEHLS